MIGPVEGVAETSVLQGAVVNVDISGAGSLVRGWAESGICAVGDAGGGVATGVRAATAPNDRGGFVEDASVAVSASNYVGCGSST
jgi:hypothetical protein